MTEDKRTCTCTLDNWCDVAIVYGFNELVKQSNTLEDRTWFRYARDVVERSLKNKGLDIVTLLFDPCTLELESGVKFYEKDIDMMREYVRKHDEMNKSDCCGDSDDCGSCEK